MPNQHLKIGLLWKSQVWKDYITDHYFDWATKVSISNHIKLLWAKSLTGSATLKEGCRELINQLSLAPKETLSEYISYLEDSSSFDDNRLLHLINILKDTDLPTVKVRESLRNFYEEQEYRGYDIFSRTLQESISNMSPIQNIIVSDCRMLIEVIDLLLIDTLLITLYNSKVEALKNISLLHSTEILWSLGSTWLWICLDISVRNEWYLTSIFQQILSTIQKPFIYSDEFKSQLRLIRQDLMLHIWPIEKSIDKEYISENPNYENYITAYQQYYKYVEQIRSLIQFEYIRHIKH